MALDCKTYSQVILGPLSIPTNNLKVYNIMIYWNQLAITDNKSCKLQRVLNAKS